MTQPTVSYALQKLRRELGEEFEEEQAAKDVGEISVLPYRMAAHLQPGPGTRLEVVPLVPGVADQLVRGEVDVFISSARFGSRRISRTLLFREDYVGLAAVEHPRSVGAEIDSDTLTAESHLAVVGVTGHAAPWQEQADRGVHVVSRVPRFTALPHLVEHSEFVAIVPRYLAEAFERTHRVRTFELPWPIEPVEVALHARHKHSRRPEQAWLIDQIITEMRGHHPTSPAKV